MKSVIFVLFLIYIFGFAFSQLTNQQLDIFRANNVTITDDTAEPQKYWIFNHHGVPSHDYGPFPSPDNPNTVSVQNHNFKIPKNPVVAATPGCLTLGTIAAAVNGVPLFNPYSGPGYNAVEGSNREIFDNCTGHPAPQGEYHYHTIPHCLYKGEVDQLIGVALDGFPIYGPLTTGGKIYVSADLDACHGIMLNNQYQYRLTSDYPYILGCYYGEHTVRQQQAGRRKKRQAGGQRPPPGSGQGPPGGQGQGGQGGGTGGYDMNSCLYVTFCENPRLGCPCSAYTWQPNAPRVSTEICNQTTGSTTTVSNIGGGTNGAGRVEGLGWSFFVQICYIVFFVCLCL